ncbi:AraC family transcriptional regulator ligand-binding domain-containing protein [Burkholderia ubonensis]|uniref:AraC family transcriptional regulator ligand-binding domain-containing protein n=1 Tax=Burkholderia ubonensis TaxID=101571 RepID=UPI001E313459|nr:AraC family transcriptional regulator ligand-binding domain-containing protein [Burkholderia ubonensis]
MTGGSDFGLRLSSRQSIDVLGPLSIVLRNAPTIRGALNDLIRCLFVHSRASPCGCLRETNTTCVPYRCRTNPSSAARCTSVSSGRGC